MPHSFETYRKKVPLVKAYQAEKSEYLNIDETKIFVEKGDYVVHTAGGVHVLPAKVFTALYEKVEYPSVGELSHGVPKE